MKKINWLGYNFKYEFKNKKDIDFKGINNFLYSEENKDKNIRMLSASPRDLKNMVVIVSKKQLNDETMKKLNIK